MMLEQEIIFKLINTLGLIKCSVRSLSQVSFVDIIDNLLEIKNLSTNLSLHQQRKICLIVGQQYSILSKFYKIKALKQSCLNTENKLNDFKITSKSILIYAGTFSPLHEGHFECIRQGLLQNMPICMILDNNPFKKVSARNPLDHYLSTLCKVLEYFGLDERINKVDLLSDFILDPSFKALDSINPTVDWISSIDIKKKYLLMGDDCFVAFSKWKNFKFILKSITGMYIVPRLENKEKIKLMQKELMQNKKDLEIIFLNRHKYQELASSKML